MKIIQPLIFASMNILLLLGCGHQPLTVQSQIQKISLPQKSCPELWSLYEERKAPIHTFALIEFLKNCGSSPEVFQQHSGIPLKKFLKDRQYLKDLEELEKTEHATLAPPWVHQYLIDQSLTMSRKLQSPDMTIELLQLKLARTTAKNEKIILYQELIPLLKSTLEKNENTILEEQLFSAEKELFTLAPRLTLLTHHKTSMDIESLKIKPFDLGVDLEKDRNFSKAREYYQKAIGELNPHVDGVRIAEILDRVRQTYKLERNLPQHLVAAESLYDFTRTLYIIDSVPEKTLFQKYSIIYQTILTYVRSLWTLGKNQLAKDLIMKLLEEKVTEDNQTANLKWLLGSIYLEEKNFPSALEEFEHTMDLKITDAKILENVSWNIFWTYYQEKNYVKSVKFANELLKKKNALTSSESFFQKLSFWKVQGEKHLLNNPKLSEKKRFHLEESYKKSLIQIKESDPFSYYGIMSELELDAFLTPLPRSIIPPIESTDDLLLDWLLAFYEESKNFELPIIQQKHIDGKYKTMEEKIFAFKTYGKTFWFEGAFRQLTRLSNKDKFQMIKDYSSVLFPTLYLEEVTVGENQFGTPRALSLSIIRQESTFNPKARSPADAFGLMQLTPETAKTTADQFGITYSQYQNLYDPKTNILLGTALLSDLLNKHQGNLIKVAAAYNAGPEALAKWLNLRYHGNYLEFIENIPYEETRNYVKIVLRNFLTYSRLLQTDMVTFNLETFSLEN